MQTNGENVGVLDTLRRLGGTLRAVGRNRFDLLLIELQEERIRLFQGLLLLAVVITAGCFTLAATTAALVFLLWDTLGVLSLVFAAILGLLITAIGYWRLSVRLKNWPFLSSTVTELKKDCECFAERN